MSDIKNSATYQWMRRDLDEQEKELDNLRAFIIWILNNKFRGPKAGKKALLQKFKEEFNKR